MFLSQLLLLQQCLSLLPILSSPKPALPPAVLPAPPPALLPSLLLASPLEKQLQYTKLEEQPQEKPEEQLQDLKSSKPYTLAGPEQLLDFKTADPEACNWCHNSY